MLKIRPTDRVLEIGSGNRPRVRSNVLCDKFVDDNTERSSQESLVVDKRPFVVADGLALPFKDKSFDYVITSHILEHVPDPHQFARELERVAHAGYIETPSELGERIFGWPFHRWLVRLEGDTIVMRPRKHDSDFGEFFHGMYATDGLFAEFVDAHFGQFYVQYEWSGTIKIGIEDDSSTAVKFNHAADRAHPRSAVKRAAIAVLRSLLSPQLRVLRHFRQFDA